MKLYWCLCFGREIRREMYHKTAARQRTQSAYASPPCQNNEIWVIWGFSLERHPPRFSLLSLERNFQQQENTASPSACKRRSCWDRFSGKAICIDCLWHFYKGWLLKLRGRGRQYANVWSLGKYSNSSCHYHILFDKCFFSGFTAEKEREKLGRCSRLNI